MVQLFQKNVLALPVFIFFIAAFFLSHLGFSIDDGGYMYGLGWRVLTGETIYTDFLYARTPFSPFFNAFIQHITPDNYEYLYIRIFFFFMVFIYSYLSILLLFEFTKIKINKSLFSIIISVAFLFNIHTNNYMWHTVDGLFFFTIGVYLLFSKKHINKHSLFGFTFLMIAFMSKQSFLLPYLLTVGLYLYSNNRNFLNNIIGVLFSFVFFTCFVYIFNIPFIEMIKQISYASSFKDLLTAGFYEYLLKGFVFFFFLLIIAPLLFIKKAPDVFNNNEYINHFIALLAITSLIIKPFLVLCANFIDAKFFPSMLHMNLQFDVLLILIYIFFSIKENIKNNTKFNEQIIWLVLLSIAWGGSISWGYQTPIFYSGIFIFMLFVIVKRDSLFDANEFIVKIMISFLIPVWLVSNYYIINGKHFLWPKEYMELGFVSEKLRGIYVNDEKELNNIIYVLQSVDHCNGTYAVKYSHTYLHWALNTPNSVSLDWISKAEAVGYDDRINNELKSVDCVIEDKDYRFLNNKRFGWNK